MQNKIVVMTVTALLILGYAFTAEANHGHKKLVRQPSPALVVSEHLDALNNCDVERLMAQYPRTIAILLPGGVTVEGRADVRDLFEGFCLPVTEGGLRGIQFTVIQNWKVGKTINTQWIADACFLLEPYYGADAYVTRRGLMGAQVTTFDGADLVFDDTKLGCAEH